MRYFAVIPSQNLPLLQGGLRRLEEVNKGDGGSGEAKGMEEGQRKKKKD